MFTDIPEELADDPWFEKISSHWVVIVQQDNSALAVFHDDTRRVFDEISFGSIKDAEAALKRNGFIKYKENPKLHQFLSLPKGSFHEEASPAGRIYSSGKYWLFVEISEGLAREPWFKVVGFLQQNWATLISQEDSILVVFYGDTRVVFDEMVFENRSDAEDALRRNGFSKYWEDPRAHEFVGLPQGNFRKNLRPIYSSGEYWE